MKINDSSLFMDGQHLTTKKINKIKINETFF